MKNKIVIILYSFCFSFVFSINPLETRVSEIIFENAKEYYFKGEYKEAIMSATQVINVDSTFSDAYFIRGDSYGFIGDFNNALLDYNRAINLNPDFVLALYQRAITQLTLGLSSNDICNDLSKVKELITIQNDFQFLIDKSPDTFVMCEQIKQTQNVSELLNIGTIYASGGRYLEAIAILHEVIYRDPLKDKAYNNIALCYYNLGDKEKALKYHLKTIEVNPNNVQALRSLGDSYYELGNLDLSLKYIKKAAQLGNEPSQKWLKNNGYNW